MKTIAAREGNRSRQFIQCPSCSAVITLNALLRYHNLHKRMYNYLGYKLTCSTENCLVPRQAPRITVFDSELGTETSFHIHNITLQYIININSENLKSVGKIYLNIVNEEMEIIRTVKL